MYVAMYYVAEALLFDFVSEARGFDLISLFDAVWQTHFRGAIF